MREYWIVQPGEKVVTIYRLGKDNLYGQPGVFARGDTTTTPQFKGMKVVLAEVFAE